MLSDDYLRLHKTNFAFREYPGREHNFSRVKPDGTLNYDDDYWQAVGCDFLRWAGLVAAVK